MDKCQEAWEVKIYRQVPTDSKAIQRDFKIIKCNKKFQIRITTKE